MRLQGLDIFRGVAIILMVVFHFCFDLVNFGYADFDLRDGDFWKYFRNIIVSMFVLTAGVSAHLTHTNGIDKKKLFKRVLLLGFASLLVSVGSYTQFPHSWIYFGILHFFLFITIIGLPFLNIPKVSLLFGTLVILGYNMSWINMHWLYTLLQEPLSLPQAYTQDMVNIIPWFGVYLIGLAAGHYKQHNVFLNIDVLNRKNRTNTFLSSLGKHSFSIYLLHQIVLFGIFYLISYFS